MPETLEDALDRTAEDAWESRAEKQKLLVNRTFRIDSVELVEFTNQNGHDDECHVATVLIDGETEPRTFWLGGALVRPQMDMMIAGGLLPAYVTLIEDSEKKGTPYRLLVPSTSPAAMAAPLASGHPHLDAFVAFCRSNGLANAEGQLKADAILERLGAKAGPEQPPHEAFSAYKAEIVKRKKVQGDDVYRVILEELVSAIGLTAPVTQPEPEIPFE